MCLRPAFPIGGVKRLEGVYHCDELGINPRAGYPEVTMGLLFLSHFECQIPASPQVSPTGRSNTPHVPRSQSTVPQVFSENPEFLSLCKWTSLRLGSPHCIVTNDLIVCVAAAGLVHGVGLVHLPGGLRPAHLEVPSGQPVHRTRTFGEVSIPLVQPLFHYACLSVCSVCPVA